VNFLSDIEVGWEITMNERDAHGLTRMELIVASGVLLVLGSMIFVPSRSYGSGKFILKIASDDASPVNKPVRVALIRRKNAAVLLAHHPHPETRWIELLSDQPLEQLVGFSVTSSQFLFGGSQQKVSVQADAIAVEYASPDEAIKFRVIPFERPHDDRIVELTVPREPPSEAEAWKPPENPGR
jgi:hypothetical protein